MFLTEGGEKSDRTKKKQSWIRSHASKKWLKTRSNYKHAHSNKHAHVSRRLPHTPVLNPAWLLSLEDQSFMHAYIIYKHTGHKTKPCYDGMWAERHRTMTHITITSQISDLRPHVMINQGSARIYSSSSYLCIKQPSKVPVASNYCGGLGWKDAGVPKMSLNQESHAASCKRFIENKMLKEEKSSSGFEF